MVANWRGMVLVGLAGLALAGCNNDHVADDATDNSAAIPDSPGASGSGDSTSPVTGDRTAPMNISPVISGSPPTQATVGAPYNFTPAANDPDGGMITFQIARKPAWATFSTATGQLSGAPASTHIGRYDNIVITVTDGFASRSLPAFSIDVQAVTDARPTNGTATLTWLPPVENSDGSPIPALSGYRIYHGPSEDALIQAVQVANAGITSHVFDALPAGTHFFAISTLSSSGLESALSAILSKTVL